MIATGRAIAAIAIASSSSLDDDLYPPYYAPGGCTIASTIINALSAL
jgi:hypothetical protein